MLMTRVKETFLLEAHSNQWAVYIYLINGIKLDGQVMQFDETVIVLSNPSQPERGRQLVYQHAIATILLSTPRQATAG